MASLQIITHLSKSEPCFIKDGKWVRAGTSPFLNAPGFDLSPGKCFAPPHQVLMSFCLNTHCRCPPPSLHRPPLSLHSSKPYVHFRHGSAVSHVMIPHISSLSKEHTSPCSPGFAQAAPAGSMATLQAATLLFGHFQMPQSVPPPAPPSTLCTEIFHHSPLTKVPFLHLFHQQTSGGCTKVLSKRVGLLPKPEARATHSQQHTLQPQPKKRQGKCLPRSKQRHGRRCSACRSKAGAGR